MKKLDELKERQAAGTWPPGTIEEAKEILAVKKETKKKTKKPSLYRVLLLNDDYTPMEFVVQVLIMFFAMDEAKATRVMMSVHTKGRGVCGTFSHEIAETKVDQVNEYSRMNQHPLMCTMEEA